MIGLQRFSEIPKRIERFHCTHFASDGFGQTLLRATAIITKECTDLASSPSILRLRFSDNYKIPKFITITILSIHFFAHAIDVPR